MRILLLNKIKWDKNYALWLAGTFLVAAICGIVLFKLANIGSFFVKYAEEYVVCVFEFNNGRLIFSHLLRELCYIYAFFALAYFTKFKFLSCIILFFRTIVCIFYCAVFFGSLGFGGVLCAVIIYIPCFLVSALSCYFVAEAYGCVAKKYVFFFPAVMALLNCLLMIILLNVVFRILIVIV